MTQKTYLYANNIAVGVSQFEATLLFQRVSLPTETKPQPGAFQMEVVEQVEVLLAFAHLKSLAASLLVTIHEYERQQGRAIQMPQDLQTRFPDALKLFTNPAPQPSATKQ